MNDDIMIIAVVVNALVIVGGVVIIVMAMIQRIKTKEMEHRERLAMIERGLAPGPERNPEAFEAWQQRSQPPARATSIGVVIVALGLGLMLLIGVAGDAAEVGFGVGGAIVVLGGAFIVNGFLQRRSQPPSPMPPITRSEPRGPAAP